MSLMISADQRMMGMLCITLPVSELSVPLGTCRRESDAHARRLQPAGLAVCRMIVSHDMLLHCCCTKNQNNYDDNSNDCNNVDVKLIMS